MNTLTYRVDLILSKIEVRFTKIGVNAITDLCRSFYELGVEL